MIGSIAASAGRRTEDITDISGLLTNEVGCEVEGSLSMLRMKRGMNKDLSLLKHIYEHNGLTIIFGKFVGMRLRLQLDPKHSGRLTIEMQQRESESNRMMTELLTALKQAKLLEFQVRRELISHASFS